MSEILTTEHKGKVLKFYVEPHKYIVGTQPLVSMTTLIHDAFPEFNGHKVAWHKAKKDLGFKDIDYSSLTAKHKAQIMKRQSELLLDWNNEANKSCEFGTKVHLIAEFLCSQDNESLAKEMATIDSDLAQWPDKVAQTYLYKQHLENFMKDFFFKKYDFIEAEKMIFSEKYRIAGTIDLLARNKETGKMAILDWKTNKEIKLDNDFNQTGKGHFSHLPDCNFSHYSLQLNGYQKILLEEEYVKPNEQFERGLFYIDADGVHFYEVAELQEEADILFHNHNEGFDAIKKVA